MSTETSALEALSCHVKLSTPWGCHTVGKPRSLAEACRDSLIDSSHWDPRQQPAARTDMSENAWGWFHTPTSASPPTFKSSQLRPQICWSRDKPSLLCPFQISDSQRCEHNKMVTVLFHHIWFDLLCINSNWKKGLFLLVLRFYTMSTSYFFPFMCFLFVHLFYV